MATIITLCNFPACNFLTETVKSFCIVFHINPFAAEINIYCRGFFLPASKTLIWCTNLYVLCNIKKCSVTCEWSSVKDRTDDCALSDAFFLSFSLYYPCLCLCIYCAVLFCLCDYHSAKGKEN